MRIDESCIVRRRFLGQMVGGGVVALGVGAAEPVISFTGNLRERPLPDFLEIDRADWDRPPGTSKIIKYGSLPVLIFRPPGRESELKVFVAFCTHLDCIVKYKPKEGHILCACHHGYYDLDGEVTSGPPPEPLRPFYFRPKGDKLVIALEKENLEKAFEKP